MAEPWQETEVAFQATDGLPLTGTLVTPVAATDRPAVVMVHGVGGNRQGVGQVAWSRELAQRGFPAMPIDTRGHDWDWSHGGREYGAGQERLDESPRDIAGAVAALRERGYTRFLLAGQSLGTVKIAYTMATAPIEGVVGVVLRSGPWFTTDVLTTHYPGRFAETMQRAEAAIAADGPDALIEVDVPLSGKYSAAAYLEKYGPHGRFDWLANLGRIAVPRLIMLGGADPLPAVQAARDAVAAWTAPPPGCEAHIVPGADHGFTGFAELSAELTAAWWRRQGGG